MRRAWFAGILFLLTGCGWVLHPVDSTAHSSGKLDTTPRLWIHLSNLPILCANPQGRASVNVYVTARFMPPTNIDLAILDVKGAHVRLEASAPDNTVTWELRNLPYGTYTVTAKADGVLTVEQNITVGYCAPEDWS